MKIFLVFIFLSLEVLSYNSPFLDRDFNKTTDFIMTHTGTIKNIVEKDLESYLYILSVPRPYLSWPLLVIKTNNKIFKKALVGQSLSLNFKHTLGDVILANPVVEESYFHALIDLEEEYLGFLTHEPAEVLSINLQKINSFSGDIGEFSTYWVHILFTDNTKARIWQRNGPIDLSKLAKPGDIILLASGQAREEIKYSKGPFGTKKVLQKHYTGPNNSEPLYKKPEYGDRLFNLTLGIEHRFN
jgi:hypothetical protein